MFDQALIDEISVDIRADSPAVGTRYASDSGKALIRHVRRRSNCPGWTRGNGRSDRSHRVPFRHPLRRGGNAQPAKEKTSQGEAESEDQPCGEDTPFP